MWFCVWQYYSVKALVPSALTGGYGPSAGVRPVQDTQVAPLKCEGRWPMMIMMHSFFNGRQVEENTYTTRKYKCFWVLFFKHRFDQR